MAEEHKENNTKVAFFLNLTFTVLELIGGIISGSAAIISDSLHDFADSISLGLGWYFENEAEKGSNEHYTYGYKRFSLLGAMINAIVLLLGAVYIVLVLKKLVEASDFFCREYPKESISPC
ncbi:MULTISPECIES: cation transporter [Rufibacter]|uniref:Cation diffusion facilitator family transporter n=1 Tax=Rufibacter quisquiliarum TaxID=1549639 RepID=A0A839GME1_9BACT|nr:MULTISPECIES: cation transporter [Rufibacter]MBA9079043.1 cation diffusion facilitator family transporter [Rufibacter quisquiliarum]